MIVAAIIFLQIITPVLSDKRAALVDADNTLSCHRRQYTYKVTETDENGRICWDYVNIMSCWGRCDSNEIADWKFPYKRSHHPVCLHAATQANEVLLRHCDPGVAPGTEVHRFTEASVCSCSLCKSSEASCEGLRFRGARRAPRETSSLLVADQLLTDGDYDAASEFQTRFDGGFDGYIEREGDKVFDGGYSESKRNTKFSKGYDYENNIAETDLLHRGNSLAITNGDATSSINEIKANSKLKKRLNLSSAPGGQDKRALLEAKTNLVAKKDIEKFGGYIDLPITADPLAFQDDQNDDEMFFVVENGQEIPLGATGRGVISSVVQRPNLSPLKSFEEAARLLTARKQWMRRNDKREPIMRSIAQLLANYRKLNLEQNLVPELGEVDRNSSHMAGISSLRQGEDEHRGDSSSRVGKDQTEGTYSPWGNDLGKEMINR
ncbi:hypothetical protein HAZT_HAZT008714 [Hyalella azteca]|uniref:Glycoprotein hormone subunit beta domain-containing protein n=1 Tax=Hyalella azteca TaxID=294128 RepID=A0A6A0H7J3_HYAAZ|nr:hypothetical protein HAZT_HAZT008714 [Hyalella azteca]